MKEIPFSYLSAALGLVLVGGMWALPATRAHQVAIHAVAQTQDQAKQSFVTGKITAVNGSDFTVEVQKQDGATDPVTFTTDNNSKVDGKLAVGAMADITYRTAKDKNIVVTASITPAPNPQS
jgi:hypothetical protein